MFVFYQFVLHFLFIFDRPKRKGGVTAALEDNNCTRGNRAVCIPSLLLIATGEPTAAIKEKVLGHYSAIVSKLKLESYCSQRDYQQNR